MYVHDWIDYVLFLYNSPAEMMKATRASNQTVTNVSLVKTIFDIREWISPHLDSIKYHTESHVFLFKKNAYGKAVMVPLSM